MALWAKTQQLSQEAFQQVRSVYGEHFPFEVRHVLASWIEQNIRTDVDFTNPQSKHYVDNLFASLIVELKAKAASLNTLKLIEAAKYFQERYSENPGNLFGLIRHGLMAEMKMVAQMKDLGGALMNVAGGRAGMMDGNIIAEMAQKIDALRRRADETKEDLSKIECEQESFAISYNECTQVNALLNRLSTQPQSQQNMEVEEKLRRQKEQQEQLLNQKENNLMQLRIHFADKLRDSIAKITNAQAKVVNDVLIKWRRDQQLSGNGALFTSNLKSIQEWCESLFELIWRNREQVNDAECLRTKLALPDPPGYQGIFLALNSQITKLLCELVTSTLIIEQQPPQILKMNNNFTCKVQLLVGGNSEINTRVKITPPEVKVSIINATQANSLLKCEKIPTSGLSSGEIQKNTGQMKYQQTTKQMSVSLREMRLKKINRSEKKETSVVMDEKFALLFQSEFSVGNGELVFQVSTMSLPVVVIVHGSQEEDAWATITWDNAFAESGRVPFAVPDKAPWRKVAEALNGKFRSATGRPLTDDNLRNLAEKAFRYEIPANQSYSNLLISWDLFTKEPLPNLPVEKSFTFWEWFYATMKLTREHLRGPWIDGSILGFVKRKQAKDMLRTCANGTFLLRFSDSELGGVLIAGICDSQNIFLLGPFTSKDFAIRSLADRISDLKQLVLLFPDIPKEQAFAEYYTPFTGNQLLSYGYLKPLLVTHVPGWDGPGVGGPTPSHSSVSGVPIGGQGGHGASHPAATSTMFQAHSSYPSVTHDTPTVASSYPPGLGQVGAPSCSSDMDYTIMDLPELPNVDEDINIQDLHDFVFSEFIQTSSPSKPE